MAKEIERKYLLENNSWRSLVSYSCTIQQGYLSSDPDRTVRIRIIDDKGILTVKGKNIGISRLEFEYDIPLEDAIELIQLCDKPLIEKTRNIVVLDSQTWEIDEFGGSNKGLVIAEIELETEDTKIELPSWIGNEVSHDPRYYNSNLVKGPING